MKVISLLQPWATLVVIGAKKIETRSWNTKYTGTILIHASKRWDWELSDIVTKIGAQQILRDAGYHALSPVNGKAKTNLPLGHIIGKVEILGTESSDLITSLVPGQKMRHSDSNTTFELTEQEKNFGDYSSGRYGWFLSNPKKFIHPIPAVGKLSLWDYTFPGNDESHILQCNKCGFSACADYFPIDKYNIDTDEESWETWCPNCENNELDLIIDNLSF